MLEKEFARERFVWWFPLCAAVCVALTLFPLTVSSSDLSVILYVVVTVPLVSLVLLGICYKRRGRQRLTALSAFALFVIFTAVLFVRFPDTTDAGRWLVFGKSCKAELLAQPSPAPTLLRHMEWEGWGFAGSDTTVYLVFDPTDTLANAAKTRKSGRFGDLPCEVFRVRQREKEWYTVQFYTDTDWEHCTD